MSYRGVHDYSSRTTSQGSIVPAIRSTPFCFGSLSFSVAVRNDVFGCNWVSVQGFDIARVGIGPGVNVLESPEGGIASPRPFTVLNGHTLISGGRR